MQVQISLIKKLSNEILTKIGVPKDEANIITDTVMYAHLRGKGTHGIGRYPIYARKVRENLMKAKTNLEVVSDSGAVMVLDANHGFGQVATFKGMEKAILKATENGVGVVGIRHSNSFGTSGYFVEMAAKENMVGIIFANSSPAIAPTGGNTSLFGTNPIGIGFPGSQNKPAIILDMATSKAARGKIRLAAKNDEQIPLGWALDKEGNPTTDPNKALEGSMIPIGDHKGFGLSLIVDVLAGALTGAAFGGDVKRLNHKDSLSNYGHLIIVLDISRFQSISEFTSKMEYLTNQVKSAGDSDNVFLPGEKSYISQSKSNGIVNISDKQVEEINKLAQSFGNKHLIKPAN